MRTLLKNTQKLQYALFQDKITVYQRDNSGNIIYDDIDGQKIPRIVEYVSGYDNPVDFRGNITFVGGESEAEIYGISIDAYDCKMVLSNDTIPITETSLIFKESVPQYDRNGRLKDHSADFRVVKVAKGLTDTVYLLKRIIHNA